MTVAEVEVENLRAIVHGETPRPPPAPVHPALTGWQLRAPQPDHLWVNVRSRSGIRPMLHAWHCAYLRSTFYLPELPNTGPLDKGIVEVDLLALHLRVTLLTVLFEAEQGREDARRFGFCERCLIHRIKA